MWIQRRKLVSEGTTPNTGGHVEQGSSVSLSSNGSILAIGNMADRDLGSVSVFN